MLSRRFFLAGAAGLALSQFVSAQDRAELANNNPVAILSLATGKPEIKRPDGNWEPAHWLTLLRPEDQLRTCPNGKILVNFFSDDHVEVLDPSTEAKLAFKNLVKISGGGVRRDKARDRAVVEMPIPYMLEKKLASRDFSQAQEPGALEKEQLFLKGSVLPDLYPPVFNWGGQAPLYRLQLFNEWDEVIYETKTAQHRFKYPYKAPFRLARNSQYLWQVVTGDDNIVVRKYPFTLLTQLHARDLERAETRFEKLKKARKLQQNHYTDLFLHYNNRKLIDRSLALLLDMSRLAPENPMVWRALVRVYLAKGCPAHAQNALNQELKLNGVDPFFD